MNESFRFPIAILVSLVCHIALLMWIVHWVKVPVPYGQGSLRVFLRSSVQEPDIRPVQLPVTTSAAAIKIPPKREQPPAETAVSSPSRNSFAQATPFRPADMMNQMQLAQLAQQREMNRMAIMARMSDMAARLRPLVTESIVCEQKTGNRIDCTPEPGMKLRSLLEQYSRLASEAHQMDVTGNPARIDFGQGLGVSVKLQP